MRHPLSVAVLAATLLSAACSPSPAQDYPALRDKIATEVQALIRDAPLSDVMNVTKPEYELVATHMARLEVYARGLHKVELPAGSADGDCRDELVATTYDVVDAGVGVFYDKPETLNGLVATLKLC